MPLLDSLAAAAAKYGPSIVKALGTTISGQGAGSGMYPGSPTSGFVGGGPRSSTGTLGTTGRKRHRRGLSASDIRGAQKVARLVQHFGYKPKVKAHRKRR